MRLQTVPGYLHCKDNNILYPSACCCLFQEHTCNGMSCTMCTCVQLYCIGIFPCCVPVNFPSVYVWTLSASSGEHVEYTGPWGTEVVTKAPVPGPCVHHGNFHIPFPASINQQLQLVFPAWKTDGKFSKDGLHSFINSLIYISNMISYAVAYYLFFV